MDLDQDAVSAQSRRTWATARPATEPPSIEFAGVRKAYGDVIAVDDVSFAIERGEFVTLLGPSGCGKTTTLRLIAGFVQPTAGVISLNGEPVDHLPPYRRPVNTVFQNYALFPHLTVGENVGYGLRVAGIPAKERSRRIAEALDLVGLGELGRRKPDQLSGGQQQRVALARALVNRPDVLLLDEPLGALDLKLRQAMQLELRRLNREIGATFVYVTHDQEEALTMSDRIAVMRAGRILQFDTPDEIYERPRNRFVAGFVGRSNFLEGPIMRADDGVVEIEVIGSGVICGRAHGELPPRGVGTIVVRPEKIALEGDFGGFGAPDGWNVLTGTIEDQIYLGGYTRYVLRLPGGGTLIVHRQHASLPAPDVTAGDKITVTFSPDATIVLEGARNEERGTRGER
ncbi:MAG TPA: ABC transporter ATP-binding protein [Thermomicrobiales bacterium]|nr:ABC transporter ATP-binding protein [Thermomicrobiales bacterium]